jgi:hypothetical protein
MRSLLAMCVGAALALNATVARSENSNGGSAASPTMATGVVHALPVETPMSIGSMIHHESRNNPAPHCVLPVMGYEYLYDPGQACTVSGYARMFQF